jgi:dihydrofolate synthase/folylpolyglutamate synthase
VAGENLDDLIEPFSRRGVDLGLERLAAALADLGHPERRFAAVQVAGTNGKGSIATLVHRSLLAAGIHAGLYTSPHLVCWTERILLGAEAITAAELRRQLLAARRAAERHGLTPFELITAAGFLAFAAAGCELVVLEVGLGGRLDATTCHPDRALVGFACVGLDHREFLGPDLASIAAEKAGVLRPGAIAVSAPQAPEVAAVLERQARLLSAELRWVAPLPQAADGSLAIAGRWCACGLAGSVQAANAAVALGLLQALAARGWPIGEEAIIAGFAAARWPGRLQQLSWHGVPLLLDGAHNPPSAVALRRELDRHPGRHGLAPGPRLWLLGILASKQGSELLEALLAPGDQAWIVPVPGHASWSRRDLAAALPALAGQLSQAPTLAAAITLAGAAAAGQRLIVAGSLYLIGALLSGERKLADGR